MIINEDKIIIEAKEDIIEIINAVMGITDQDVAEDIIELFSELTGLHYYVVNGCLGCICDAYRGEPMDIKDGAKIIFSTMSNKDITDYVNDRFMQGFYSIKSILNSSKEIIRVDRELKALNDEREALQEKIYVLNLKIKKKKEERVNFESGGFKSGDC